MKRRVLEKTTPFHAFSKKKKNKNKTVSFLDGTVSPSPSPGHATGEEKFCFFIPCFFPCLFLPHALEPKSDATHLKMRCQSSCVPQATPPLATAVGAMAEQATCTPCMGGNGMGQGRSRSPAPINTVRVQKKEGEGQKEKKERRERQQTGRETERERNRPREREEQPKQRNQKTGDIDKETERDSRGEGRKRIKRKNRQGRKRRLVSLHSGEEAPLLSLGLTVIATAAPPRTATVIASSTARDHRLR